MNFIRFGVLGTGNIGQQHIALLRSGEIKNAKLTATASRSGEAADTSIPHYTGIDELLAADCIDVLLVATPTMGHVEPAEKALARGVHVLLEKPIAMSVGQASALIEKKPRDTLLAVMLNQRFHPAYAALKALLSENVVGTIQRYSWTMTAWYRPDVYYKVSSWRGTWPGEGGGLLLNQCIHNLDVMQWLFGLPSSVSSKVAFGRYHDIDVEDEVSAILHYQSGITGLLQASSGEAPGINRLEIIGDEGMLSWDDAEMTLLRADQNVREHCKTTREMFGMPTFSRDLIELKTGVNQHAQVIQNVVDALLEQATLLIPATEGLGSLELANAMLLSEWEQKPTAVPIDANRYEGLLQQKIASASLREPAKIDVDIDMEKSYR